MHFVRRNSVLFYDAGIVCYRSTPIPQTITPKHSLTTKTIPICNDSIASYEKSSDTVEDVVDHQISFGTSYTNKLIDLVPNKPLNLLDLLVDLKSREEKPKEKKIINTEHSGALPFLDEITKNWPKYEDKTEQDDEKPKPKYSYNVLKGKGIFSDEKPIHHGIGYIPPNLRSMHEKSIIYKNIDKTSEQKTIEFLINRSYLYRMDLYNQFNDVGLKQPADINHSPDKSTNTHIDTNNDKLTANEDEFSSITTFGSSQSSDNIILNKEDIPSSDVSSIYNRIMSNSTQRRSITDEEIYRAIDSPFTIRSMKSFNMDLFKLCSTLNSRSNSRAISRYTTTIETVKPITDKLAPSIPVSPDEFDSGVALYSESFRRNSYMQSKSLSRDYQLDSPQDSGKLEVTSDIFTEYKIDYPENEKTLFNEKKSSSHDDYFLNELYKNKSLFSAKSSYSDLYVSNIMKTPSDVSLKLTEKRYSDASKSEIEPDLSKENIDVLQKGDSVHSLGHLFTSNFDIQDQITKTKSFENVESTISLNHLFTNTTQLDDKINKSKSFEKADSTISLNHLFTSQTQIEDQVSKTRSFGQVDVEHEVQEKPGSYDEDDFITETKVAETEPEEEKQEQIEKDGTTELTRNVVRPLRNNRNDILIYGFEATAYIINTDRPSTSSDCTIFFDYENDKLIFKLENSVFDMCATDMYCEIIRKRRGNRAYLKIIMEDCVDSVIAIYCENTEYIEILGGTIGWANDRSKLDEKDKNSKKPQARKSLFGGIMSKEKENSECTKEKEEKGKLETERCK
ncbi:uncharacterized protein TA12760 [Theileria annulata]|uniref:Uncharacterized protein n=1 Tax=Theileria annulata TaxID=5874 RepID=Q4UE65_THEAN|nr:uncharacterized protein TA12760 [Theileria annulata]CAI74624.1 hypothetical protein TA12760 [Theileria annulata]|eukprot:XP_952356.1 hypothetical protein TA12760 [Theileria annulata]